MNTSNSLATAELTRLLARTGKNLSREFSTPLKQLIGPLEQLIATEQETERAEQLQLALHNAYRFHSLVTVLEEIADLESGEVHFVFHESDVVKFSQGMVHSFEGVASSRHIRLQFHSSVQQLVGYYDYAKLRRVIYTLLANAIRYSDKEMSEISVSLQPVNGAPCLRLNITDNGIGIAADKIPNLTNPFYDDPLHLQLYQSTSLSLYLVKRLLEEVGGSMNYLSEKGAGTTVEVLFPIYPNAAAIPLQQFSIDKNIVPELVQGKEMIKEVDTYEIIDHQPNQHKHIPQLLVYQEDPAIASDLFNCLKQDFRVILANKISKVMQLAMEQQPDIILVSADWNPSVKSLISFLKQTDLTAHIPLCWLTEELDDALRLEATACWVDGISTSANHAALLVAEMQKMLKNRQLAYDYAAKQSITALSKPRQAPSMEESFLERLHFVIEKNLHEASPDLKTYCEMMHYSRAQLHRKVKAITGLSTSNYIREHKLKLALKDLQEGVSNVSEIAYKYGFGSLAYFSRVFKASFGLSPSHVRTKTTGSSA